MLRPHSAILMYPGICSDASLVCDLDVARERCGICHYDLAAELAIVSNVRLRHEQIAVADTCHAAAALSAAMYSYKLSDLIAFSDLGACRLATIFQVLRSESDRNEWKYMRAVAHRGFAVDDHV